MTTEDKSVIVEGYPTGDCECFCIEVTEEVFLAVAGENELKWYHRENEWDLEDHLERGQPKETFKPKPPMLYPLHIIHSLTKAENRKLKFEIKLLEVGDLHPDLKEGED
jgi:hypothetical protein